MHGCYLIDYKKHSHLQNSKFLKCVQYHTLTLKNNYKGKILANLYNKNPRHEKKLPAYFGRLLPYSPTFGEIYVTTLCYLRIPCAD